MYYEISDCFGKTGSKISEGENIKRLKGHQDLLRLRVGDYRVIYTVNNGKLIVCVVDIGNRGDVYKRY